MNNHIRTQTTTPYTDNGTGLATVQTISHGRGAPRRRLAIRESVTNVDGCCTIDYIAGFLGHADLREQMVRDGLIQRDGLPYQRFIDRSLLVVVEGEGGLPEVLVTPWGMSWLLNCYPMTDEARCTHQAVKAIQ